MFNLACCYEKIGNHELAYRNFDSLLLIKPDWAEAFYGASLSAFRLQNYPIALG